MIDLSKNILYEDEDILAIDKPAGLIVHPDGRTEEPSVSGWFADKYPESKGVGEPMGEIERPGVVHRIDRETSGLLLLAKTDKGHSALKQQFKDREVDKTYHMFVYGEMKEAHGVIDKPVGRSIGNFRKWSTELLHRLGRRTTRGQTREAVTHFRVLERSREQGVTLVEARPKTGRTHQLRVHFKALNHPVVCDKLYAPKKPCLLGFDRLALHARAISFQNVEGESISLEAPYPEDFQGAVDIIG